jgi:alginate O-acetyltransferase complex protein AlgI
MVLFSMVFYAWWKPWYLTLIVLSAALDYVAGARIARARERRLKRTWMTLSLCCNLGILAVFKYTPFVLSNLAVPSSTFADWVIPVGISFYTFQTLSYSLDIYRGRIQPARSFRDFLLFVSFFPQLVAGPIVRAGELLPQFRQRRRLLPMAVQTGFYHVITGLFLKVVVADNLAVPVEAVFSLEALPTLAPMSAWLGVVYFGVQIFADFAGYSGIAIGLAYLMGLRFPQNFNYPYVSRGLSEFWTRWHMTLSFWLRDYLYISLGGNRKGRRKTYLFLMLTMLLGGLWHGAAWTFIAWGGMHGLGLCIERALRGGRRPRGPAGSPAGPAELSLRLLQIALVFVFVNTAWVFFRAESFHMAWLLLERMYVAPFSGPFGFDQLTEARHLVLVLPVFAMHVAQLVHEWCGLRKSPVLRAATAAVFLFLLTVIRRDATSEFIYFQF